MRRRTKDFLTLWLVFLLAVAVVVGVVVAGLLLAGVHPGLAAVYSIVIGAGLLAWWVTAA
jgi:hypothetical protein